jgi:hypothetical protein
MTDLRVALDGNKITVSEVGTDMWVSYDKPPHLPHLVLTDTWLNYMTMSREVSVFRARAFQAAVTKARELGWIA